MLKTFSESKGIEDSRKPEAAFQFATARGNHEADQKKKVSQPNARKDNF